jgi:methionyl aminopeptidase
MRGAVKIRTPEEISKAKVAGRLAAQVLQMITPHVQPDVSTDAIDKLCHDYIVDELKVTPANIGYHGFPKTLCSSVNEVVCHGIPSAAKILKEGDIVNLDVALIKDGWFGDTSRMYFVGEPKPAARRLVNTTYEAMRAGIMKVRPGATLGDVGYAIQSVAHRDGFSVVREYGGHGIGDIYHDEPHVNHFGKPGDGLVLKEGMIFTVEPMINAGKRGVKQLSDGWTVVTQDRSLSAQWEHMVLVTAAGFELLTAWPEGVGHYPDFV